MDLHTCCVPNCPNSSSVFSIENHGEIKLGFSNYGRYRGYIMPTRIFHWLYDHRIDIKRVNEPFWWAVMSHTFVGGHYIKPESIGVKTLGSDIRVGFLLNQEYPTLATPDMLFLERLRDCVMKIIQPQQVTCVFGPQGLGVFTPTNLRR